MYHEAAAAIRKRLEGRQPLLAVVLGSGQGALADQLEDPIVIPYEDIPGFAVSTVTGHAGRLVIGRIGACEVLCMQGRVHVYEGLPLAQIALPVRSFRLLDIEYLMLTNAAGSLRDDVAPGSLVAISDHINWAGINPLIGPNDDALGPRFPDMSALYDAELRGWLYECALAERISISEGVYLMTSGPSFETPAEIRAFQVMGADLVGMSTVPEALAARHAGIKVVAMSVVTNYAAGIGPHPLTHDETIKTALAASDRTVRLLSRFIRDFPRHI